MAQLLRHKLLKRLVNLAGQGSSALTGILNDGIVLLDSDGNYLMDEGGNVLYAADELFTAGGEYFSTADGAIYGVPA